MTELVKQVNELDAMVVGQIQGRDVTVGELRVAFDAVCDKSNWKLPINRIVHADDYLVALIREAVIWFAGCVPTITPKSGTTTSGMALYRVEAVGYYEAVGA